LSLVASKASHNDVSLTEESVTVSPLSRPANAVSNAILGGHDGGRVKVLRAAVCLSNKRLDKGAKISHAAIQLAIEKRV
jgi:hypothetical protein